MQMAEQHRPGCPVTGCGVWKGNLSRRGGSNRRWYSVYSNRHLLFGQLDEALAALPCNDHICPNCYKRIRRLSKTAHNLLDELKYGSTPANWTRCQNPRKASDNVLHR
jgi:hypothetical protein